MPILRRATEQRQSEWRNVPEGLWRWEIGEAEVTRSERFSNYRVKFPLVLTEEEKARLAEELGDPPEGVNQSWRANYSTGLSLGWVSNTGEYKTTKLVDFLAACFGSKNQRRFREWIAAGGGPRLTDDMSDEEQIEAIKDWLEWWKGLEVYGTIRHEPDATTPGKFWARFGGPMPVGSIPGQPDPDYQAHGLGKLRAMTLELGGAEREADATPAPQNIEPKPAPTPRSYEEVFGPEPDDDEDAAPVRRQPAA